MHNILVVYTGGTIGMTQSSGGWIPTDTGRALVESRIRQICDQHEINLAFHSASQQFDSSQARPEYWVALASEIESLASGQCGVVLIHGTDTLSYAAAMLSFLLLGLEQPLLVTGAQRPLCLPDSDADRNLHDALTVITRLESREVVVSFGGLVLTGERACKVSSRSNQAFSTPGTDLVGRVANGVFDRSPARFGKAGREPLKIDPARSPRLANLVVSPMLDLQMLDVIIASEPSGLLLELYGLGTMPVHEHNMLERLQQLSESGTRILSISQCCRGGLELSTYPSGRALLDQGVIDGKTLSRPAAFAKLWCALAELSEPGPQIIASRWRSEIDQAL